MSLIERFTRDAASRYIWGPLTLAAIAALVFLMTSGASAVEDERRLAEASATGYVDQVLAARLEGSNLTGPVSGQAEQSLRAAVERSILSDGRVERVRIWAPNGSLLFSTDRADRPGSHAALNDELLREASDGKTITRSDISDTGGADDHERSLLRTYTPFAGSVIAEIDQTDEGTLAPVRSEWLGYQILAGLCVALFLILSILSLRDPLEPINAGVPFAASSVPPGRSLIDDDRLHAVQEVYRLASERVERMKAKLEESEEARLRLEGDIQQALSKAALGTGYVAPQVTAPAPVEQVPEQEVVQAPLGDSWVAAPAGPPVHADEEPAPAKPERTKKPARRRERKRVKPQTPAAASAAEAPIRDEAAPSDEVVAVPEVAAVAAKSTSPAAPDVDDARAHEAALATFIRLTESDRQPHDTSEVDQGAVRAALARTAARKKPGGERLSAHDEGPAESPGGPPR
jgi:hypothetical protein